MESDTNISMTCYSDEEIYRPEMVRPVNRYAQDFNHNLFRELFTNNHEEFFGYTWMGRTI